MNLIEINRALRQLRLGGAGRRTGNPFATAAEAMVPIDLISCLISDELTRRQIDCWSGGASKPTFATPKPPWITSILTLIRR